MQRTVRESTDSVTVVFPFPATRQSWHHLQQVKSIAQQQWVKCQIDSLSCHQIAIEHQQQTPMRCQKRCEREWQLTCHCPLSEVWNIDCNYQDVPIFFQFYLLWVPPLLNCCPRHVPRLPIWEIRSCSLGMISDIMLRSQGEKKGIYIFFEGIVRSR